MISFCECCPNNVFCAVSKKSPLSDERFCFCSSLLDVLPFQLSLAFLKVIVSIAVSSYFPQKFNDIVQIEEFVLFMQYMS